MSSKEIAQKVGLTPQTVDTYIKAAMAKLVVDNRREAARMLASQETSQQSGSPSKTLAAPPENRNHDPAAERVGWRNSLLPPPIGGSRNDMNAAEKTLAVLKVAVIAGIVVLALALSIAGALYTFR